MKYTSLIKLVRNDVFFIFLILSADAFSQFSSSPYSIFGIGDRQFAYSAQSSTMGYAAISLNDPSYINTINPASYASRDSLNFIFDVTVTNRFNYLKTNTENDYDLQSNANQILMGFRISKWWGTTFGLAPFSSCGYAIESDKEEPNIGNVSYFFKGDGSLNKFFWGNGIALHKNISIGFNAGFVYGYLDHFNSAILPSGESYYSSLRNRLVVNDFYFNYGLLYHNKNNDKSNYSIGLIFDNAQKLNARSSYLATKSIFLNTTIIDTIHYSETKGKLIELPMRCGIGASYSTKKWLFAGDYTFSQWSKLTINQQNASMSDESQIHIGVKLLPNKNAFGQYYKRIAYRMGGYYTNTSLMVNDNQLKQFGITFGVGLPLRKTKTTLNIAFDLGKRGTINNNLIEEYYGLLRINLNLHDIWFIKSKFD